MVLTDLCSFDELTNEAERLVITELGKYLEEQELLPGISEDLILDLATYALNNVRPMYRVNLMGRVYADTLMEEHGEEIRGAVRQAVKKIL